MKAGTRVEINRQDVQQVVERSKEWMEVAVGAGTTALGNQLYRRAEIARDTAGELNKRGQAQAADAVTVVAERMERIATYLRGTSGAQVVHDAEEFARNKAWLVAGVGFLGGLVLSRAIRASARK